MLAGSIVSNVGGDDYVDVYTVKSTDKRTPYKRDQALIVNRSIQIETGRHICFVALQQTPQQQQQQQQQQSRLIS
jgi:hypothetical protein